MALITCPECEKQISDQAEACPNCGYPLKAKKDQQQKEGVKILDEQEEKTSDFVENGEKTNRKSKRIAFISVSVLAVVCLFVLISFPSVFLSDEAKDERIAQAYANDGYDAALDLVLEYYGDSEETTLWILALDKKENEKLVDQIEIVSQDLTLKNTGNYYDYTVTVKNNSNQTVNYIKVNIYLQDKDKNIIQSEWTNWSGNLPAGASTNLAKMIEYRDGIEYYTVSVDEVS